MHVYPDGKKKKKKEKVQWKKDTIHFNEIQVQKGFEEKTKFHLLLRKLDEQSMAINPIQ